MPALPVWFVCADADIVYGLVCSTARVFYGDDERFHTTCAKNVAAVAIGLLDEMLTSVFHYVLPCQQFCILLYRCEIGCGEDEHKRRKRKIK